MIKDQDLSELAAGTFELRCGEMHLYPGTASRQQGSTGAGYLRQLPSGELSLVMFIGSQPPPPEIIWDTKRKSGELLGDGDYYTLEAQDFAGRHWKASRVRPNFTQFHGGTSQLWMAEATVRELQGADSLGRRSGSSVQLWYRGEFDFPFQLAVRQLETAGDVTLSESVGIAAAKFVNAGREFFARHQAGYLVVSAGSSEAVLEQDLERRVNEAMEFLLARRLAWTAVQRREGGRVSWRLTGGPTNEARGRLQLPVAFTSGVRCECDAALDLFARFLERVRSHVGDGLPPLSLAVKVALESNRSPIDAQALDLAVAVEAILRTEFSGLGQPDARLPTELVQARDAVESLSISEETKQRLGGSISSMASVSAKSRLLELVSRGVIGMPELRAWEAIRHRGAHGTFIAGVDQSYVDAFGRLVMLLYRLIFAAVGYEGPFRDYGELGWPWRGMAE
jgi:hypothetical protein